MSDAEGSGAGHKFMQAWDANTDEEKSTALVLYYQRGSGRLLFPTSLIRTTYFQPSSPYIHRVWVDLGGDLGPSSQFES